MAVVQDAAEPNQTGRGWATMYLVSALLANLQASYDQEQADEAARLAAELLDHPQHGVQARMALAQVLLLGQPEDPAQADPAVLHRVIRYAREAMERIPESDRNHREARKLLIQALFRRFFTVRDTADLAEALPAHRCLAARGPIRDVPAAGGATGR